MLGKAFCEVLKIVRKRALYDFLRTLEALELQLSFFASKESMTYKNFRKIQVYILIAIAVFIFTKNFHLIFQTRNITELAQKKPLDLVFLVKNQENEGKTKLEADFSCFKPSDGSFWLDSREYIKDKQSKSFSRLSVLFDRGVLMVKSLIDSFICSLKFILVSVKHRYLLSQSSLSAERELFLKRLEGLVGSRGRPLAEGLLFGDVSGIDRETYHSFKVIGILHILSASSANFTLILQFILFLLGPLKSYLSKKQTFYLYFAIILLYFSLVGPAASTTRAFLTLSATFYATFVLQRTNYSLFNLFLAGFFMLFINPFYLDSLGFQFSFLASFGIIFLYNYLEKEPFINKNYILKSILLTFCAQFFLAPILIFNFGELNYLAILANFLVLPLVELLTISFLASFIGLFFFEAFDLLIIERFISFLIIKTIYILFFLINILEKIPWKSLTFIENKDLFTFLFILINFLTISWVFWQKSKKYSKNKYRIFR